MTQPAEPSSVSTGGFNTVGIVGAGAMGRGIAQIAAEAGLQVMLHDDRPDAIREALGAIAGRWDRHVEKQRVSPQQAEAWAARLHAAETLEDLAKCDIVIEAIVENLEAKRALFQQLEALLPATAVLATNTSSLSVTAIAAVCEHPQRVIGFHFFNPVPLMKVVEVIPGLRTAANVTERVGALGESLGHFPALTTDTPGFLVNHAGRAYVTEALMAVGEGVADHATIDRILTAQGEFRMGPFTLMDLTGLDVTHVAMESIYHQFYQESRLRPSAITRRRLEAGLLGRKTGEGFYRYQQGQAEMPAPPHPASADPLPVWIATRDPAIRDTLTALVETAGWPLEAGPRPGDTALCLLTPFGEDATTCASRLGLDASRCVAIDMLADPARHRSVMTTPATHSAYRQAALALFGHDGTAVSALEDSNGFIFQRVIACIVNVACDIAQQGIADPETIDRAVVLGLGYPVGPLALGERYGPRRILEILDNIHAASGDPRYRPSPWLRRRATLALPLNGTAR